MRMDRKEFLAKETHNTLAKTCRVKSQSSLWLGRQSGLCVAVTANLSRPPSSASLSMLPSALFGQMRFFCVRRQT